MRGARWITLAGLAALTACGGTRDGQTNLRNFGSSGSPEEFAIVPNKPLVTPEGPLGLPAPTPDGANRADVTPLQDAVAALGGDPSQLARGAVPASDAALVNAARRNGSDPAIRAQLAREDAAYRRRNSLFSWQITRDDRYERVYRGQALDAEGALDAARRPGRDIRTPSAPPPSRR